MMDVGGPSCPLHHDAFVTVKLTTMLFRALTTASLVLRSTVCALANGKPLPVVTKLPFGLNSLIMF